jgi:hypothetical protein
MRYEIHVPVEEYGYIAAVDIANAEEAVLAYREIKNTYEDIPGLSKEEWNYLIDNYLEEGKLSGDPGRLHDLSKLQQWFVNEIKKSIKRRNG